MKLTPTPCYVPISVEDYHPDIGKEMICFTETGRVKTDESPLSGDIVSWLKPTTDSYLLSREEIVELLGDAFEKGVTLGRDYELSGGCPIARNKNEYINEICTDIK